MSELPQLDTPGRSPFSQAHTDFTDEECSELVRSGASAGAPLIRSPSKLEQIQMRYLNLTTPKKRETREVSSDDVLLPSGLVKCDSLISVKADDDSVPFELESVSRHALDGTTGAIDVPEADDLPDRIWAYCHARNATVTKQQPVRSFDAEIMADGFCRPVALTRGRQRLTQMIARHSALQKERDEKAARPPKPSPLQGRFDRSIAAIRYEKFIDEKRLRPEFSRALEGRGTRKAQTRPGSPGRP
jgi:hypothetical protein